MRKTPGGVKFELLIFGTIVLAGGLLRLAKLDYLPLQDAEALNALSAAVGTKGASAFFTPVEPTGASPLYTSLTRLIFMLFPIGDAAPRIIPAFFGTCLLFVPWLVRKHIGTVNALILTFLLSFNPLMITISRTASSAMLTAASGFIFAACMLKVMGSHSSESDSSRHYGTAAAISFVLFLASGIESITGILIAALSYYLFGLTRDRSFFHSTFVSMINWFRDMKWTLVITAAIVLTGAGFHPGGLSEFFSAVNQWLNGWTDSGNYPAGTALASIVLYDPFWIIGISGIILGIIRRRRPDYLAFIWLVSSVFIFMIYPARSGPGMIWMVSALIVLTGQALHALLTWIMQEPREDISLEVGGAALVLMVLLIYAYLQVGGFVQQIPSAEMEAVISRLTIAVGALSTAVVVIVFFGMGWGWKFAALSSTVALGSLLTAGMISSIWHLNLLPSASTAGEIWRVEVSRKEILSYFSSLENISIANYGDSYELNVHLASNSSPVLAWYLRPYDRYISDEEFAPEIVVVPAAELSINLPDAYTGRVDVLFERKGWHQAFPPNPFRWWFKRQSPILYEEWALLVRSDLMFIETEPLSDQEESIFDESME